MANDNTIQRCFSDFVAECKYLSQLSAETIRGYTAIFRLFILIVPEVTQPHLLTSEMITEFFKRLQTRERLVGKVVWRTGVKANTIKTYRSKLNTFFIWLEKKQLLLENPLKNIKAPKVAYTDIRALSEIDIRKMYAAVSLHSQSFLSLRRDTAMISLLAFCGLRLGEFVALEVHDIDFEKQLLTVRSKTSKSGKIRHIPLHPTLQLHLRDYISERNKLQYKTPFLLVSTKSDTALSRHGLKHWVATLGHRSGVRFHLHQLRHFFACNLATKDVNPIKIQKLLGHSSLDMTLTYLRSLGTENMQDDINRMSI